jgi:hypothetical protein
VYPTLQLSHNDVLGIVAVWVVGVGGPESVSEQVGAVKMRSWPSLSVSAAAAYRDTLRMLIGLQALHGMRPQAHRGYREDVSLG